MSLLYRSTIQRFRTERFRTERFRTERFRTELLWVLVILALSSGLTVARHEAPRRVASSGDSFWYMRQADIFAGTAPERAGDNAAVEMCRDMNRADRAQGRAPSCTTYGYRRIPERYRAIFDSRPGFPLLASPLVRLLGAWRGMVLTTMLLAVLAGLLIYLAVRLALGSRRAALVATVLLYLLPSGFWITRMLAEGAMVVGYLGVLIGAMLLWRGRRSGLPITVLALLGTFSVKPASGVAVGAALVAACLGALLSRGRGPQPPRAAGPIGLGQVGGAPSVARRPSMAGVLTAGGVGLTGLGAWFAVSNALHLPSLGETIQDYATRHFTRPDVADPLGWLLSKNVYFWSRWVEEQLVTPLPLVAFGIAGIVLVARTRHLALLWIAVGLAGVPIMIGHPMESEYDRLMMAMWLPVAAASGYLVTMLPRLVRGADGPPHPAPEPPAVRSPGHPAPPARSAAPVRPLALPNRWRA